MISQLFDRVIAQVKAAIRAVVLEVALLCVASFFGMVVVIFLLMAAYDGLVLIVPPHFAALILAAVFSVLCLTCVFASGVMKKPKSSSSSPPPPAELTQSPSLPGVKKQIETIASSLSSRGFRREGALLQAAAAVSRDVKPIQLLAISLLGGFILGRRFEKK